MAAEISHIVEKGIATIAPLIPQYIAEGSFRELGKQILNQSIQWLIERLKGSVSLQQWLNQPNDTDKQSQIVRTIIEKAESDRSFKEELQKHFQEIILQAQVNQTVTQHGEKAINIGSVTGSLHIGDVNNKAPDNK